MNLIPYKGEGPTITDILGGHVQMTYATPTSTLPHIREGKLKPLAVLLPARSSLLPQVPTVAEAGLPTLTAGTWAALYGPAKLPAEIASRMSRELNAAMARPDVRDKIEKQGFDLSGSTPAELGSFMVEQLQAWAKAFSDAGMQPE
jgi:tripartite-type tricarboxylate transporter receptor subunit TctC